jgi:DNA-binding NarL/FixJ family response regulator
LTPSPIDLSKGYTGCACGSRDSTTVLQLIVQGARNNDIAQHLHIAVKTVETHLTSIYGKLGVQSRAEAIALAQRQGLLLEANAE